MISERGMLSCAGFYTTKKPVSEYRWQFKLTEGQGLITSLATSDGDGLVRCDMNMQPGYSKK